MCRCMYIFKIKYWMKKFDVSYVAEIETFSLVLYSSLYIYMTCQFVSFGEHLRVKRHLMESRILN